MFEAFLENKNNWISGKGPFSDIVFSSRVRLARNLSNYPFPAKMSLSEKKELLQTVKKVFDRSELLRKSSFVFMGETSDVDRRFLLERHLISQEHIADPQGKALIVSDDERVSIMVNEEDHLRIQAISSGFSFDDCWPILNAIDDELNSELGFSFSSNFGYLTSCPTNVGTALRVSCMLHLPALVYTKRINKILELLIKISFTARGLFGEGTQALGNLFQVSNQVSLGLSEKELIDNLTTVINQVKTQELDARNIVMKKYRLSIEDNVCRALAILKNCRLISTREALSHLSMLSLGLDLGIIKGTDSAVDKRRRESVQSLFVLIQPAHLQKFEEEELLESKRDYIRASMLRENLQGVEL